MSNVNETDTNTAILEDADAILAKDEGSKHGINIGVIC